MYALAERMPGRFRVLVLPEILADELGPHIDQYAEPGPEGLLFRGPKGAALRRSNFGRSTKWTTLVVAVGLPVGFHSTISATPVTSSPPRVRPRAS